VGSLRTYTRLCLPVQRVRAKETEIHWSGARSPSLSPSDTPQCRAIRQCRTHATGKPQRSGRLRATPDSCSPRPNSCRYAVRPCTSWPSARRIVTSSVQNVAARSASREMASVSNSPISSSPKRIPDCEDRQKTLGFSL
jgi:hypothetical protein